MFKSNILLLFFVFVFLFACTKSQIDKVVTPTARDSTEYYLKLASSQAAEKENYTLKAYKSLLKSNSRDSIFFKYLFRISSNFYSTEQNQLFKRTSKFAYDEGLEIQDTLVVLKAAMYLGKFYADAGINDSSFYYYSKAEKYALKKNDSISLSSIYVNKAFVQLHQNDFFGCELSASKALNVLRGNSDSRKEYDSYNLIGICASEMKSYDRAIDYYNRAYQTAKESDLPFEYHLTANSLNNLGVVYQEKGEHIKAITYFNEALAESNLFKDSPALYAILLDNLAYSKFKAGDNNGLPGLFYKSLNIRDSLNLFSGIVVNKIHLSEYFFQKKDTVKAKGLALESLELSKLTRTSGDILAALKNIAVVDHGNAAQYSKEYIRINDSIQQAERKIRDRFERIQFETDEISLEREKLAEQNRTLLYFFVVSFMIGLLLFVIRTQRARNRELLLKQTQQKANEEIYNLMISQQTAIEEIRVKEKRRIAQELHDGVLGRLFGTRLNLDSLNRNSNIEAVGLRSRYISELKNIEQDLREISHDLNREKNALINNFLAILHNLVEEQQLSFPNTKIELSIDPKIDWDSVNNLLKINIYRIIQESLQNINKYAQANIVTINLKINFENNLIVNITDDGVGFEINTKKKGIGLQNMLTRANEMNGTFDIRSKKGKGTVVSAIFPLSVF